MYIIQFINIYLTLACRMSVYVCRAVWWSELLDVSCRWPHWMASLLQLSFKLQCPAHHTRHWIL